MYSVLTIEFRLKFEFFYFDGLDFFGEQESSMRRDKPKIRIDDGTYLLGFELEGEK